MRLTTKRRQYVQLWMCIGFALCIIGCKASFTFTGFNLPKEVETVSIQTFYNEALDGPANMGVRFTEDFKEYYQRNTPLTQIPSGGDLEFEGVIDLYDVKPIAAGADELQNAELQRLTISVSVTFVNNYEDDKSFENKKFSFYADFDADQNLQDVEDQLIDDIFEQIIFDIFNKTVADW